METSIVGHLTARGRRDLIVAGHQQITREWWQQRRDEFELFVSQLVVNEATAGDPQAAAERLALMESCPSLDITEEAVALARRLVQAGAVSPRAVEDALHIALAVVHGMDYLVTWNCRHIANAEVRAKVERICRAAGYEPPVICTPEEFMGERNHVD